MKKKKKKIETVRLITFDQAVIDVVGGTVLRREILENFIVANNKMMTVVGGNSLLRLGKNLAAGSYVLRINRESSLWKYCMRWETNLSIARLIKSELNSVFKRFLAILTSVINYCKISQNIVLFWVQIG